MKGEMGTALSIGHSGKYSTVMKDIRGYQEKHAFEKWMVETKHDNLFTIDNLAHICSDEGIRVDLCNCASKFTTVAVDGFKSTIDSANRARDAEMVEKTLGTFEKGQRQC